MRRTGALVLLVVLLSGGALFIEQRTRSGVGRAPCHVIAAAGTASTGYDLDLAQAANATTIAAVGKKLGLPDHAVSIALSAALLESRLHNLDHGDRDSLGLFQQRPSQGWGTPAQLMTPRYAATAFYRRLVHVSRWQTLPVTVAAQRVQRSALPNGYAREEGEARALASALTGEVRAGMTCHVAIPATPAPAKLSDAMTAELGSPTIDTTVAPARGWTVALWLVAHASEYRVLSVGFGGMRWNASGGSWVSAPPATSRVVIATR
jgi:hypothetical protein